MAIDWDDVRYRGDKADVDELFKVYRIGDYLDATEEQRRLHDRGAREQLLKDGIRLSERISPRIYRLFHEVSERLQLDSNVEVFCVPESGINAFAIIDIHDKATYSLIGVSSGALEHLEDEEIKSILGHEVGHFLFRNNRMNALISTDRSNPSATVLPPFGESLFLRWRKKAEISADRVGLLASGSFHASARALMKATFGLSEKNLNLDVEALVSQVDEIKGRPELMEQAFASHPLIPVRLKALDLFSRSEKAGRNGLSVEGKRMSDKDLESAVDELVAMTRRYPFKRTDEAVMKIIAYSGVLILGSDKDICDDEIKILIQILQHWFTDEPESVIITDREEVLKRLPEEIALVKAEGSEQDKAFVLSRLADIALADGALLDQEGAAILQVAESLGVQQRAAYGVMIGAAQAVGFRIDAKLNRLAESMRKSLRVGLGK
ncbi:MAG: M48 family metalloprotease [Candidatus Eisenbacteria bacterium]|nr:M48 family metalloprotease [Candidatus Eisenbacteria bacterium]